MLDRILVIGFVSSLAFSVYAYWPVIKYILGLH